MAGPVFSGSLQLTSRLLLDFGVARTVGRAGVAGASGTFVTLIVTALASLPPWPVGDRHRHIECGLVVSKS